MTQIDDKKLRELAQDLPSAMPSAALDAKILAAAQSAATTPTQTQTNIGKGRQWQTPLSVAACMVLCFGVLNMLPHNNDELIEYQGAAADSPQQQVQDKRTASEQHIPPSAGKASAKEGKLTALAAEPVTYGADKNEKFDDLAPVDQPAPEMTREMRPAISVGEISLSKTPLGNSSTSAELASPNNDESDLEEQEDNDAPVLVAEESGFGLHVEPNAETNRDSSPDSSPDSNLDSASARNTGARRERVVQPAPVAAPATIAASGRLDRGNVGMAISRPRPQTPAQSTAKSTATSAAKPIAQPKARKEAETQAEILADVQESRETVGGMAAPTESVTSADKKVAPKQTAARRQPPQPPLSQQLEMVTQTWRNGERLKALKHLKRIKQYYPRFKLSAWLNAQEWPLTPQEWSLLGITQPASRSNN